jgi:SAM-dependent methyltransferase
MENLNRFGYAADRSEIFLSEAEGYAEPFLRLLGAESVESFDASDYEGATQIHDFNTPVPEQFKNKFTVVLDGGTLEHIFNFPTAIKNCLEMVATGGHFLSITPTNNFLGHGFYQFSPELYFRILSRDYGYSLEQLIIFEDFIGSNWYSVTDPDAVHERVTLINNKPAYLLIIAKRIEVLPIFEKMPQQSDYFALWQQSNETNKPPKVESENVSDQSFILRTMRKSVRRLRLMKYQYDQSRGAFNEKSNHFKKIDW